MQEGARWRQCIPPTQYPKLFDISYDDIPEGSDVPKVIKHILKQICTQLQEFKEAKQDTYKVSQLLNCVHVTNLPTDRKQELYHKFRHLAYKFNMLPRAVDIQEVTVITPTTLGIILRLPQAE